MAEYRLGFDADTRAASRNINELQRQISEVSKEFNDAEINSARFIREASKLSGLNQELRDARTAVVGLDRAYKGLADSIASFRSGMGARGAIPSLASPIRGGIDIAGSPEYIRAQAKEYERAYQDLLQAADTRARAIAEFRSGMAGRGAISGVASPIRGGADIIGSPDFLQPLSLGRLENRLTKLKEEARRINPDSDKWRAINKEAIELERGIERIQKRQRLGPTMGQRAGAAGGAFLYGGGLGGGVGSALGGVAGGLAGGVPGAFAGAALGQLSDNIGQALGATASYTAEIDKQRIALKNVTKDVAEYQNALAFIDKTSRDLAIPQDVLNKQFTQLSASVIGAGGDIGLAKEAFIGIAAGIRGTGGSLADMEGALRATAQVFSKGKVSAEELRQQIGERLPGAFTLFAKSMGKTPQELDKMLEQGQVTLNDFMGFVRTLSTEYGASASEIAASSQAAGDRLATTMSRMREAVGRELQPLGAQFQEIIANVVADNEGNLVALAKAFSQAAQAIGGFIEKYGELIASLASTILLFGGTILAVKGIGIAFAAIGPAITTASAAIAGYGGVMATLKLAIAGLGGPITLTIAGLVLLAKGVYDTNETFRNFVENIGGILATDFKNAVDGMASDTRTAASEVENAFDTLKQNLQPIGNFIAQFFEDVFGSVSDNGESSASNVDNAFTTAFNNILSQGAAAFSGLSALIGNWWNSLPAPIRNILGGNTASILVGAAGYAGSRVSQASKGKPERQGPYVPERLQKAPPEGTMPRPFPGGGGGGGTSGGRAAKTPKAAKTRESELPLLVIELATQQQIFQIERDIRSARLGGNDLEVIRLQGLQQQLKINQQIAELKLDKVTPSDEKAVQLQLLLGKAEQERLDNTFEMESQIIQQYQAMQDAVIGIGAAADMELEGRKQYEALLREGMRPTLAKITTEVNQQFAIEKQKLTLLGSQIKDQILVLESKEALTKEDKKQLRILKERLALTEGGVTAIPGLAQGVIDAQVQSEAPKTMESYLGEGLEASEKRLQELANTGYQVVEAANAIGSAFGTAFKGMINGSMTVQEAFAGMFQSLADHFADMVAQMIAEWLKAQLIRGFQSLFSAALPGLGATAGGLSSAFGAAGPTFNPAAFTGGFSFANGGIASGGFTAFANGGMVTGPTMGLVGEGKYNEAIVPLPDGRSIPVQMKGPGGGGLREAMSGNNGKASGSPILNMSFQSTNINGVEYVSRDQLEAAMATTRKQAAKDGANRGMTMTLDKLQQSPQTRTRLGMG
jgi:tape measure domain-containing protein